MSFRGLEQDMHQRRIKRIEKEDMGLSQILYYCILIPLYLCQFNMENDDGP